MPGSEIQSLKCYEFSSEDSQCYTCRPNVYFKPRKGVQSISNLWGLEGRRALTGATCVVLCKRMKGLKNAEHNGHKEWLRLAVNEVIESDLRGSPLLLPGQRF